MEFLLGNWKLIGGLILAAIIVGGLAYIVHVWNSNQDQILTLTTNNTKLKDANDSNQRANENRHKIDQIAEQETKTIEEVDKQSAERIANAQKRLRDTENQAAILARRNDATQAQKLLDEENANLACFIENFSNSNGECVNGKFQVRTK